MKKIDIYHYITNEKCDGVWKRLDEYCSFDSEWIENFNDDEVKTSNVIHSDDSLRLQEISRLSQMCLDLPNRFVDISLRQTPLTLSKGKTKLYGMHM